MIKISHETPIILLEQSREFNDYSYCLPHLMDQNEEYKNFFLNEKVLGREIYMDNSLHELKVAYDSKRLLYWLEQLRPSNFFIPDVWEDKVGSIVNAKKWSKIEIPEGIMKVAVVQGKSLGDAIECVQIYKDLGYKKIAFSYGASYYNELFPHPNKDFGKAMGRLLVISKLYEMKLLTDHSKVHLLGSAYPNEFFFYKDFKFIESLDTSNPVMAALEELVYTERGLQQKPTINMNSSFDIKKHNLPPYFDYDLNHNLIMFKQINGLA